MLPALEEWAYMWTYQRTYRDMELGLQCLERSTVCSAFSFFFSYVCLYYWGALPFCSYSDSIFSFCSIISLWVLYNFIGVVRLVSGRHFEIVVLIYETSSSQKCFLQSLRQTR
jgi:hypothetical protein